MRRNLMKPRPIARLAIGLMYVYAPILMEAFTMPGQSRCIHVLCLIMMEPRCCRDMQLSGGIETSTSDNMMEPTGLKLPMSGKFHIHVTELPVNSYN
jgi:hypothetical protein